MVMRVKFVGNLRCSRIWASPAVPRGIPAKEACIGFLMLCDLDNQKRRHPTLLNTHSRALCCATGINMRAVSKGPGKCLRISCLLGTLAIRMELLFREIEAGVLWYTYGDRRRGDHQTVAQYPEVVTPFLIRFLMTPTSLHSLYDPNPLFLLHKFQFPLPVDDPSFQTTCWSFLIVSPPIAPNTDHAVWWIFGSHHQCYGHLLPAIDGA